MSNNTNNLSVFARALSENREFKNGKINAVSVGSVAEARKWIANVKSLLIPAYAVRVYRYNHMGDSEVAEQCDLSPVYNALHPVLNMVGEVNGAKLFSENVIEEVISNAMKFRVIDISNEMASARCDLREARKVKDDSEEAMAHYEQCKAEVARLEELPGNCKRIPEIQSDSAFVKAVEILLGDAINKQTAKPAEQVAAEKEAKRQERRAKTKAKQQEKKAQNNTVAA